MTTLKQKLVDDVSVFVNVDEFAEDSKSIIHRPDGVAAKDCRIDGVFYRDDEPGSNEVLGDGAAISEKVEGERERMTGYLECASTYVIKKGDILVIQDEIWHFRRHKGRDRGMQTLLLVRADHRFTQQPSTRLVPRRGG